MNDELTVAKALIKLAGGYADGYVPNIFDMRQAGHTLVMPGLWACNDTRREWGLVWLEDGPHRFAVYRGAVSLTQQEHADV